MAVACAVLCVLAASAVFALFSLLSNCRSGFTSVIHNTSLAVGSCQDGKFDQPKQIMVTELTDILTLLTDVTD